MRNKPVIEENILIWLCWDSNHGHLDNRANSIPLSYT